MNARHTQFVQEYLADPELNATRAYQRVYPRSTAAAARRSASDLLTRPDVSAAIAAARQTRLEETKVTATWIVERLRVEATNNGDGATHTGRVRALELLGRHQGIFIDRLKLEGEVRTSPTSPVNLASLNDGQLRQLIGILEAASASSAPSGPVAGSSSPSRPA